MIDAQQEDFQVELAAALDITHDELTQLEYQIHEETGHSGEGSYGHYVEFDSDNPPSIMGKIKGLENNCVVRFAPYDPPFDR